MNQKTAERLYEYRKKAGLSQDQLAEKIGVSRQAVSKWERGEASPDTDNLIALSEVYGVTLDELIKGNDKENEQPKAEKNKTKNTDVHISFKNGTLSVNDERRNEKVNISFKGFSVDTPDTSVHIGDDFTLKNGHIFYNKPHKNRSAVHNFFNKLPYPVLTIIAYFLFGFIDFCGGWAYGWLIFLTIPLYYTLISAIIKRNASLFAYPVLVIFVYLLLGFNYTLWHPWWLLFATIPFYYFLSEFIKKLTDEHFK